MRNIGIALTILAAVLFSAGTAESFCDVAIDGRVICNFDISDYIGLLTEPSVSLGGSARIYFDMTLGKLRCSEDGAGYVDCIGSGSGSSIVLDLSDDGLDESTGVTEIATTGDTNSVFSEPSADKLLIDLTNNWPVADAATALAANGSNCSAGSYALGVDASGAAEGCTDATTEISGSISTHTSDTSAHHSPVTLAADADTLLGLSSQALSLDTQSANLIFAGPTSGVAADPSFRSLVDNDIPNSITVDLAATATALAANGANCSAGNYPLGVDASGAAESCTAIPSAVSTRIFEALAITTGNSSTALTVTADNAVLLDGDDEPKLFSSISETCTITTSGIGGLEASDTEGSSKWYEIHLYGKSDGTIDCLLNEAGTAVTTTPTGYTFTGLVGYVRNNGSSNFAGFHQFDRDVFYSAATEVLSGGTASTYTNVDVSSVVPPKGRIAKCIAFSTSGVSHFLLVRVDGDTGAGYDVISFISTYQTSEVDVPLSSSQVFEYKNNISSRDTTIRVHGYEINI